MLVLPGLSAGKPSRMQSVNQVVSSFYYELIAVEDGGRAYIIKDTLLIDNNEAMERSAAALISTRMSIYRRPEDRAPRLRVINTVSFISCGKLLTHRNTSPIEHV